jgi:hypothetical protein
VLLDHLNKHDLPKATVIEIAAATLESAVQHARQRS